MVVVRSEKQWPIRKHFQDVCKVLIGLEDLKWTMLHLQNDSFSTKLAFERSSVLLKSVFVLFSSISK